MYNEEKYNAFEKHMHEKFPLIFAKPYGGFAIGEGWWPIIESLCSNIQHYIDWQNKNHEKHPIVPQVVVAQIKEKFGGLRFYYEGGDENISGMVRMAEAWADHSCEECRKPAVRRMGGWVRTLCDEHEAERQKQMRRYNDEDDFPTSGV